MGGTLRFAHPTILRVLDALDQLDGMT